MFSLILAAALAVSDPVAMPVEVASPLAPLHGTLLTPDGETRAAAVIIAGSGPTDRDGNNPMGVRAASYRLLAEGLAEEGVATLRYDKRGIAASAAAMGAEADLRFDHMVDDALAFAAEARARTGRPCVWLIGHSEGTGVALKAVARDDDGICGLVLLSGLGRRPRVIIEEQLGAQLPEPLRTRTFEALARIEAGELVADTPPELAALLRPSVQPFLIGLLGLDPAALIAGYDGPVMIGQGSTDLQTTVVDARVLSEAQPEAQLTIWDGVNHLLKVAPADRAANLATYGNPDLPLAQGVVEDVATFILTPR
ncbi:alpha/beta hydrolase [Brevundimonas sp. AAP58]|uniref:alpha/beta hydrolase n=1 Tax=Brevundimonas sp. AAP58 TaxID=1523422 RepID=UPI0006B9F6C9|nr:alpha/beta fold hydrolase [Brevundimonas sp. AAP58]KPF76471.1 alpha/beta hydrolase [Brevundimonas sp. AAP58]